jgi:hypothetical protein
MLTPARITELLVELVFVLLGVLVAYLGVAGLIRFDRHSVVWLVISVALIAWGLMALAKPALGRAKWQKWNRGGSLMLLGGVLLAISRVPFLWVTKLLVVAGLVLLVRGVVGSILIFKQP